MFTLPQQQFLSLLRAGLWGTPADPGQFPERTDWNAIIRIAIEQAVLVIVADGIETLPQEAWPPKDILLKLTMLRVKTQQMHQVLNGTLRQVGGILDSHGIPSVLLKGQGVAQNYRLPESRACGDIDLYVGGKNYMPACGILEKIKGAQMPDTTECDSHIVIKINNAIVELHHKTDVLYGKKKNDSWQDWTLRNIDENFDSTALPQKEINGYPVKTPPPTYNAIYLLQHATRHLVSEGIGFRHVCDWAIFLHKHYMDIELEVLKSKIEEYKLSASWAVFSILAHYYVGVPKEHIPFFIDHKKSKGDLLASYIFESGNFGRYNSVKRDNSRSYIKRKWHNFRFQMLRLFKLASIIPAYTLNYGWGWMTDAVQRFIKKD